MAKSNSHSTSVRLSREVWLEKALEVLRFDGNAGLQIENITKRLGVTKGSFYWHFKDRGDFRRSVLDYWDQVYTRQVVAKVETLGGTAKQKLRSLIVVVASDNLSGYDDFINGWAAHEPEIAARVQQVYDFRYKYMKSLFAEIGFKGIELDTRTVACLGLLMSERIMPPGNQSRPSKSRIDDWVRFFTRK